MNYEQFLLIARAFTLWRFTKPRPANGSPIVVIADTFYQAEVKNQKLVIVDVREYGPHEPNTSKSVPALDFFTLYEKGIVKPYYPTA